MSGKLGGGEPLKEENLARRFGVSRGPIRDAILQLTTEGILVARPNRGAIVSRAPSPGTRTFLVQLRREIEAFAAGALTQADLDVLLPSLENNLILYRAACGTKDFEKVVELDMAFHRLIVSGASAENLEPVWLPVMAGMSLAYSRHANLMESHAEHSGIFEKLTAGRLAVAASRLRKHIV